MYVFQFRIFSDIEDIRQIVQGNLAYFDMVPSDLNVSDKLHLCILLYFPVCSTDELLEY